MTNLIKSERRDSIKFPSKPHVSSFGSFNSRAPTSMSRRMPTQKNVEVRTNETFDTVDLRHDMRLCFEEYEQEIVEWVDESKVSLCPSCAKSFGLYRRKHHCRLDGFVMCNQCSQYLPFSTARKIRLVEILPRNLLSSGYLIEPNAPSSSGVPPNSMTLKRSTSLTSLTSNTGADDSVSNQKDGSTQEDYLRICLSCRQVLQRRFDQISFQQTEKDPIFLHYEVNSVDLTVISFDAVLCASLENYRSTERDREHPCHLFKHR